MSKDKLQNKRWLQNHRINNVGVTEKLCSGCGEWKEENWDNFYYNNKQYPERGFQGQCKECSRKSRNEYTANNLEIVLKRNKKWKDENSEKNLDYMHKRYRQRKDEYREYTKSWVKNNPQKAKEYCQQHRNHDITLTEWEACKRYFNYKCAYCGLPIAEHFKTRNGITKLEDFHKEHIDNEGANDLRNCVPACNSCNSLKNTKTITELLDGSYIEEFTEEKYNIITTWMLEDYKFYIEPKLPYKIIRKHNDDNRTYHYELWTVDDLRNTIRCIAKADKLRGLDIHIKKHFDINK